MSRKRWFILMYVGLLTYFSLEILVRRWLWSQIPTQGSTVFVYGLLASNGWVVVQLLASQRRAPSKRTEKN